MILTQIFDKHRRTSNQKLSHETKSAKHHHIVSNPYIPNLKVQLKLVRRNSIYYIFNIFQYTISSYLKLKIIPKNQIYRNTLYIIPTIYTQYHSSTQNTRTRKSKIPKKNQKIGNKKNVYSNKYII